MSLLGPGSAGSASSPEQVLFSSLEKFYENPKHVETFKQVVGGKGPVSLRMLEWFVTIYSKKTGFRISRPDGKLFNVYGDYDAHLESFCKKYFDPFRRDFKFEFQGVKTTLAQMNYIKWVIRSGLYEYCTKHAGAIRKAMMAASKEDKKTKEKTPTKKRETSRAKSKECHVSVVKFKHSFE